MAVTHETELYPPIKKYYEAQGYDVKSEVMHCDLVAVHPNGGETVIVEMKKTFNLALLLQGIERLRLTSHVVLAVERNRKKSGAHNQRFGDLTELCRMLGLGLMTITFFKTKAPVVEFLCTPGEMPVRGRRRLRESRLMNEFHERTGDYNTGGSTKRKIVTAYREKALRIAWALSVNDTLSPLKAAELTGVAKAAMMLQKDYYGWFERVGRGQYRLRSAGSTALAAHSELIDQWLHSRPGGASHKETIPNE